MRTIVLYIYVHYSIYAARAAHTHTHTHTSRSLGLFFLLAPEARGEFPRDAETAFRNVVWGYIYQRYVAEISKVSARYARGTSWGGVVQCSCATNTVAILLPLFCFGAEVLMDFNGLYRAVTRWFWSAYSLNARQFECFAKAIIAFFFNRINSYNRALRREKSA